MSRRETRFQRLTRTRLLLLDVLVILDGEIETQLQRRHTQLQNYERRKARGQCAAKASCTAAVVPGYTCCAYHLRKSAEATARGRVKIRKAG